MSKEKASQDEIYREMRREIEQGTYKSSERLPSVRTLAKRYQASPNTISKVVSRLMESGLCTAKRGVGLFVRTLPNRKLTVLVGATQPAPGDDLMGAIEKRLAERCTTDGIEIDRLHILPGDPPYGPDIDRIRKPGRALLCLGIGHEPYLKQLSDLRRPMLCVGSAPSRCSASAVVPNSFRHGYLAARHLIRKGCRRVAFIGRMREVRGVSLPDPESLKEQAGVQCALMEDGLPLHSDLVFSDVGQVAARSAGLSAMPDGLIMPDHEGVEGVQAIKALGGKAERVVIADDRILDRARRPTAVVLRRDDMADLVLAELNRLLDEQSRGLRTFLVDGDLHEASLG